MYVTKKKAQVRYITFFFSCQPYAEKSTLYKQITISNHWREVRTFHIYFSVSQPKSHMEKSYVKEKVEELGGRGHATAKIGVAVHEPTASMLRSSKAGFIVLIPQEENYLTVYFFCLQYKFDKYFSFLFCSLNVC